MLAIGCLEAGIATPKDVLLFFAAGTIGGLLPDIDSDHSVPVHILFSFLAITLAFLAVFSRAAAYSLVELSLLWAGVYVLVRHVAGRLFTAFTVHRGIFHSLLAAGFFWAGTTAMTYHVFALTPLTAWCTGAFVGLGYITHLTLDELYSVDLAGAVLKRSFGTALKLARFDNLKATLLLGSATLLLFLCATPKADTFVRTIGNPHIYTNLRQKLLPKERWFKRVSLLVTDKRVRLRAAID
jgi:hypothetical protein